MEPDTVQTQNKPFECRVILRRCSYSTMTKHSYDFIIVSDNAFRFPPIGESLPLGCIVNQGGISPEAA